MDWFLPKRRFWVKNKAKIRNLKTLKNNLILKPDKNGKNLTA